MVFSHFANKPIARKHVAPKNPRTQLQQSHRARFKAAQSMFHEGFNDYTGALTGATEAAITAYLKAVSKYKTANPIQPKQYAAGFESLPVPQRAYAIGHVMRNRLQVHLLSSGELHNDSGQELEILCFNQAGASLASVTIANNAQAALTLETVAIVVSNSTVERTAITNLDTLGSTGGVDDDMTELIVVASMGMYD